MTLLRVRAASPLAGFVLRLVLTDGTKVDRDVESLLTGPIFEPLKNDPSLFQQVRVEAGSVAWPNGADLDPDVLIWGGPPPEGRAAHPPKKLKPKLAAKIA